MDDCLVERWKVKDIKFAPYNPRKISDREMQKLEDSMEEFGYTDKLVVNRKTGHVVGGNQRLKVLKNTDLDEVFVIVVDVDLNKEKALNIALNKISGDWDTAKLAEVLKDMDNINLDLTGFDAKEVSEILEKDFEVAEPEYDITPELLEAHNYVVLYFDKEIDWLNAVEKLGLKTVKTPDSKEGYIRAGIGRVIRGANVLKRLKDEL